MDQEIEIRRRKVQKYKIKGWKQYEIAKALGVTEQTISADIKALNERYRKLVTDNPQYLERRVEKILEWLDKYELIIKQLYDLKDGNTVVNEKIIGIVDRFLLEIDEPKELENNDNKAANDTYRKEKKEYEDREYDRREFRRLLNSLAKSNTADMISLLKEIRSTLSEQAKVLQLITGNKTYVQQNNYIHIDKLNMIFEKIQFIIEKYIVQDKRKEAYEILKTIDVENKGGENE